MMLPDHRRLQSQFFNLKRAVKLVWESSPGWTAASIGLALWQGLLPLAALYLTKLIIDKIGTALAAPALTAPIERFGEVLPLLGLAAIVALAFDLGRGLTGLAAEAQSQTVTDYVRNLLHAKSSELDLEYYENPQYYDALHRAQAEATYRPAYILDRLLQTGQNTLSLAAMAFLLVSLHWLTALVLFAAVLPGVYLRLKNANTVYRKAREWTPKERRADYFSWILTQEDHAKELRLFGLSRFLQERYQSLRKEIRRDKFELARRRTIIELSTRFSATLAVFAAWGFMAHQALLGVITLGSLVMYYQAFQRGQSLLQETLSNLANLYENSLFLLNFYEFLDLKPKITDPAEPYPVPEPLREGIKFEEVRFKYPNSVSPVLDGVSFMLRAGETVALVGENGAGKTTLIKLLCRLYDPEAGSISLDGVDLRDFSVDQLRKQISVVFQDYAHYNLTVRENIGFGNLELALGDLEAVRMAACLSGADSAVEKLAQGYETVLGNQFEEGQELSLGEWQKIAIARAFLRQAQIVVLDEPTSALDAKAEFEVFKQFRRLSAGRTAILISHRLSTVRLADRIIVLENGKITENGTHEELVALGGTYARLFEIQAQSYRL